MWTFPGGAVDNRNFFSPRVRFAEGISETEQMLLFDPQTSGGLLLAVPEISMGKFMEQAAKKGIPAWEIGKVLDGSGIEVVR